MYVIYTVAIGISCWSPLGTDIAGCFVLPPNGGLYHPESPSPVDGWPEYCVENRSDRLGHVQMRLSDGKRLEVLMGVGVQPCAVPVS